MDLVSTLVGNDVPRRASPRGQQWKVQNSPQVAVSDTEKLEKSNKAAQSEQANQPAQSSLQIEVAGNVLTAMLKFVLSHSVSEILIGQGCLASHT